jgi:nitrite reductase/ring-hydroxylating ferredoxin subunit
VEENLVSVGHIADLGEEGYFVAKLPDGSEVIVLRAGGNLYAVQRRCPHEAAPLERGQVWNKMIRCGQHGFAFELETGQGLNCTGYQIRCYTVEQKNDEIYLRVPVEKGVDHA